MLTHAILVANVHDLLESNSEDTHGCLIRRGFEARRSMRERAVALKDMSERSKDRRLGFWMRSVINLQLSELARIRGVEHKSIMDPNPGMTPNRRGQALRSIPGTFFMLHASCGEARIFESSRL
jgi:hypothetical protein